MSFLFGLLLIWLIDLYSICICGHVLRWLLFYFTCLMCLKLIDVLFGTFTYSQFMSFLFGCLEMFLIDFFSIWMFLMFLIDFFSIWPLGHPLGHPLPIRPLFWQKAIHLSIWIVSTCSEFIAFYFDVWNLS